MNKVILVFYYHYIHDLFILLMLPIDYLML
jgi:hypothetical protein